MFFWFLKKLRAINSQKGFLSKIIGFNFLFLVYPSDVYLTAYKTANFIYRNLFLLQCRREEKVNKGLFSPDCMIRQGKLMKIAL